MGAIKHGGVYCAYLRKSRRDEELEALGQGETLARHEQALRALAGRLGIGVASWYREVCSGDTIAGRPEMQRMLSDIGQGKWDGVLCMDVDRLGRGDSVDQGIIMQTLTYTGTLIITPDKIYDPADEADGEFFEIKLFFSRREFAMIKKRMKRGRDAAAQEGLWIHPAPYGYRIVRCTTGRGSTLEPVPEEAEIVRKIFAWYAGEEGKPIGRRAICDRLEAMGITGPGGVGWNQATIRYIHKNPTYIGRVTNSRRVTSTQIIDGKKVITRTSNDDAPFVEGKHPALIPRELWDRVQDIYARQIKSSTRRDMQVANPFHGLLFCAECGWAIQRQSRTVQTVKHGKYQYSYMRCFNRNCTQCAGLDFYAVEEMIMETLSGWVGEYEARAEDYAYHRATTISAAKKQRAALYAAQKKTAEQIGRLYDLLETGVYTIDEYRTRRVELDARMDAQRARLEEIERLCAPPPGETNFAPLVRTALEGYQAAQTEEEKHQILQAVIRRMEVSRAPGSKNPREGILLTVHPNLPGMPGEMGKNV